MVAALMLGLAAVFSAVCAYQAALADGDALEGYTRSTRTLNDANTFYTQGNQKSSQDQQLFVAYASALQADDVDLAGYLRDLMRPEMVETVDWWEKQKLQGDPLVLRGDSPYTMSEFDQAKALEAEAAKSFDRGARENEHGDDLELAMVLLSITLFFGGIAPLFRRRMAVGGLLGVAGTSLLLGTSVMLAALST